VGNQQYNKPAPAQRTIFKIKCWVDRQRDPTYFCKISDIIKIEQSGVKAMSTTERVRWTTADLELLPDNGNRYEIIGGELVVTRAPHWEHQNIVDNVCRTLNNWSIETGLGKAATTAGLIFTDGDNVIPDVVWVSYERLAQILDESGHLAGAPELVVEVMSPGEENERRDLQYKLKLYSVQGVREYWIFDRLQQKVEVYLRENGILKLAMTLFKEDNLTSVLLPGFSVSVAALFA
jgi:Uma2 family endonuclease